MSTPPLPDPVRALAARLVAEGRSVGLPLALRNLTLAEAYAIGLHASRSDTLPPSVAMIVDAHAAAAAQLDAERAAGIAAALRVATGDPAPAAAEVAA